MLFDFVVEKKNKIFFDKKDLIIDTDRYENLIHIKIENENLKTLSNKNIDKLKINDFEENKNRNLNISINSSTNIINNISEIDNKNNINSTYIGNDSDIITTKIINDRIKNDIFFENNIKSRIKNIESDSNKMNLNKKNNNTNWDREKSASRTQYNNLYKNNDNIPLPFQSKIFQNENLFKKTSSNNNKNNHEFKNVNKFLNVSNYIPNKGVLITDYRENNNSSFIDENNNVVLKTCSNINTKKKKIELDVIDDCIKKFNEKNKIKFKIDTSDYDSNSKTFIKRNNNIILDKDKIINQINDLISFNNDNILKGGSLSTKNSTNLNKNDSLIEKVKIKTRNYTHKKDNYNLNEVINRKPNIPTATKNLNIIEFEFFEGFLTKDPKINNSLK